MRLTAIRLRLDLLEMFGCDGMRTGHWGGSTYLPGSGIVHVSRNRHWDGQDDVIAKMTRQENLHRELKQCETLIQSVRCDMEKLPHDSQRILLLLAWSERIPLASLAEIYGLSRRRMQEMIHAAAMEIVAQPAGLRAGKR